MIRKKGRRELSATLQRLALWLHLGGNVGGIPWKAEIKAKPFGAKLLSEL
jgi:hypothetical protein